MVGDISQELGNAATAVDTDTPEIDMVIRGLQILELQREQGMASAEEAQMLLLHHIHLNEGAEEIRHSYTPSGYMRESGKLLISTGLVEAHESRDSRDPDKYQELKLKPGMLEALKDPRMSVRDGWKAAFLVGVDGQFIDASEMDRQIDLHPVNDPRM